MAKKKIDNIIVFVFFILALGITMFGLRMFWVGFHNTDLCANEMVISEMYDIELKEVRLDGEVWSLRDCYLMGLKQIVKGFYVSLLGMFMVGITAGILALKD